MRLNFQNVIGWKGSSVHSGHSKKLGHLEEIKVIAMER